MAPDTLADLFVLLHLGFVCFVLFGGLLVIRWRRLAWLHIPAFLWGGAIEIGGWICPLTHLENRYRALAYQERYSETFVEHYLMPLIYPEVLFQGGFPREGFIVIGIVVLLLNSGLYLWIFRRKKQGKTIPVP